MLKSWNWLGRCAQCLKNGAFDGRRELYPDHGAILMGIRNGLLKAMGSLQNPLKGIDSNDPIQDHWIIDHMSLNTER